MLSPARTRLPIGAPVAKAREPVPTSTSDVPELSAATSSSFAFVLPVRPEWDGNLASITPTGPRWIGYPRRGSNLPPATLPNLQTGQVRGSASRVSRCRSAAGFLMPRLGPIELGAIGPIRCGGEVVVRKTGAGAQARGTDSLLIRWRGRISSMKILFAGRLFANLTKEWKWT